MQIESMHADGAVVTVVQMDIASNADVEALRARLLPLPKLRGVIHAAGTLDDAVVAEQSAARMRTVASSKMFGAVNIEELLAGRDFDFYVSYSSVASVFGTGGQANYAAANAFLDAQAQALRACGIAATSINFGPFATAGLATQGRGLQRLREQGLRGLRVEHANFALDRAGNSASGQMIVADWDVASWVEVHHAPAEMRRLSALLPSRSGSSSVAVPQEQDFLQKLSVAVGEKQRRDMTRDLVRGEVSTVLRLLVSQVDPTRALRQLGVDSLLAIELRNRLERITQMRLPGTLIFSYPTVNAIADHLGSLLTVGNQHSPRVATGADSRLADEITHLSVEARVDAAIDTHTDAEVDSLADAMSELSAEELQRLLFFDAEQSA